MIGQMMKHHFICGLLLVLAGCTLGPEKREPPTVFDFGPPRAVTTAATVINATVLISPVTANHWLDTPNIHYRMAQRDASRTDTYAQSHWTQSPAVLLTERLRARMAGVTRGVVAPLDGAKADYALRVELEDFSQTFSDAQTSKVTARLRATLIDMSTRALRAQKTFVSERPAAPNAAGAAQALGAAADAVVDDIATWAQQQLK